MDKTTTSLLIVDDESDVTETLSQFLESHFSPVWVAENGKIAFEKCTTNKPDIILCDFFMPEMSGEAFLKKIRTKGILSPVVFLTGNASKEFVITALQLGASDVLEKPFDLNVVLQTLNRVLEIERRKLELALDRDLNPEELQHKKKMVGLLKVSNSNKKTG